MNESASAGELSDARAAHWFIVRFTITLFLASLAFSIGQLHRHLFWLQSAIAHAAGFGARALGCPAEVDGTLIAVKSSAKINVNHECTGIFIVVMYAAFVLAYPARWRDRLSGILFGVAAIEVVNVARLVTLTAIATYWMKAFTYLHEYLWQGVLVGFVGVLVVRWSSGLSASARADGPRSESPGP